MANAMEQVLMERSTQPKTAPQAVRDGNTQGVTAGTDSAAVVVLEHADAGCLGPDPEWMRLIGERGEPSRRPGRLGGRS